MEMDIEYLTTMTSQSNNSTAAAAGTTRDLSNNATSSQVMTSTIDVIDRYVTPVWYVAGVPGNVMAFVVWTQRTMRASSGCYLAALAFNDCVFLLLQVNDAQYTILSTKLFGDMALSLSYPTLLYNYELL